MEALSKEEKDSKAAEGASKSCIGYRVRSKQQSNGVTNGGRTNRELFSTSDNEEGNEESSEDFVVYDQGSGPISVTNKGTGKQEAISVPSAGGKQMVQCLRTYMSGALDVGIF